MVVRHFKFVKILNLNFIKIFICSGKRSLETICLVLAFKVKYPQNFFLLRGNHESASINRLVMLVVVLSKMGVLDGGHCVCMCE